MHRSLSLLVSFLVATACLGCGSGGGGGVVGDVTVACSYPAKFTCGALTVHGSPAAQVARDMCMQDGGSALTTCPAANLIGCCTQSVLKNCFYTGGTTTAAQGQTDCTTAQGTWSTSP